MSTVATRPAAAAPIRVTTGLYDRADQQHLTAVDQAQAVLAWHTGLDIQATRPANGRVQLVIKGRVIAHQFPEMAVAVLCQQTRKAAINLVKLHYGIDL
jgi:hypothetical protein